MMAFERGGGEIEENSPVEEVAFTVSTEDDPSIPVWTFRMWFLGLLSCITLSFVNQFFGYRKELVVTQISVQVAALPIGRFMASFLPTRKFRVPLLGVHWSLNPGPFSVKEHVLITIFANAGYAFGNGSAYAVGIVNIIKAFYQREISIVASWRIIITTQVLGYGWAGLLREYVVEPAHMWWPSTLVQGAAREAQWKGHFSWEVFLYCNDMQLLLLRISWVFIFHLVEHIMGVLDLASVVTAQQIGSGMRGLGVGAFTLDWSTISSFLQSSGSPFFAIMNVLAGYVLVVYLAVPLAFWGSNTYGANKFPIFSSDLFDAQGHNYNITRIVNNKFELEITQAYEQNGRIHMSLFFALNYGFGFAAIASTLTHVFLFYGRDIWQRAIASRSSPPDIHTKLMREYGDIPQWWFYTLLIATLVVSFIMCEYYKEQVQFPWWGLLLACVLASLFTLPISVITATTNQ
ncbi:hypothetical protein KI387_020238, partial [Taxus chinensis]